MESLRSITVDMDGQAYELRFSRFPIHSIDLRIIKAPEFDRIFQVLDRIFASLGSNDASNYYYYYKNHKGEIVRHCPGEIPNYRKEMLTEEGFSDSLKDTRTFLGFVIVV